MLVVITTTSTLDEAKKIAKKLVEAKKAACIHIEPIESIYFWEGKVIEDREYRLVIKIKKELYKEVETFIKNLHSYSIPQIIALEVKESLKEYKDWVEDVSRE